MASAIQVARMAHRRLHRNVKMLKVLGRCAMEEIPGGWDSVRPHVRSVPLACLLAGRSPESVVPSVQTDSATKCVKMQISFGACVRRISGGELSANHIAPFALHAPLVVFFLHRTPAVTAPITPPGPAPLSAGSISWDPLMHFRAVVIQKWNPWHLRLRLVQLLVKG